MALCISGTSCACVLAQCLDKRANAAIAVSLCQQRVASPSLRLHRVRPAALGAFCLMQIDGSSLSSSQNENEEQEGEAVTEAEMKATVRLVESAMLAATAGLAYFLSNLLRIESYFGCFFPLPIVISSLRWGASAGRKTMVTTALLLFVIAGPVKTASYLLTHGVLGLAMGAIWRWKIGWGLSIVLSTLVRACGALGFVLLSSWLFRENILNLITMNTHASLSYMTASMGINVVFTMPMIYILFALLLLVNCASFVFILHVLYVIFLHRLGVASTLSTPTWVKNAI